MDTYRKTGWSAPQSEASAVTPASDPSHSDSMVSSESFNEMHNLMAGLALKAEKMGRMEMTIYEDGDDKIIAAADTRGNPGVSEGSGARNSTQRQKSRAANRLLPRRPLGLRNVRLPTPQL